MVVTDPAGAVELAGTTLTNATDAPIGDQLRLRRLLAMAFSHPNQLDKARETCEASLALPGASDAPVEVARVRLASMQPLAMLDRVDEAITAGEDALVVLEHESNAALADRAA